MVQSRCGAGFPLKALHGWGITRKLFRQELQRNAASEFDVLGLVNHAHASAAQDFQHAVMRNPLADPIAVDTFRGRRRCLRLLPLHFCLPAIPAPCQSLDKFRTFGGVAEHLAKAVHRCIDAVLELNNGVVGP